MGRFRCKVRICTPDMKQFEEVEAVVDTGAAYTWIPKDILGRLGIQPKFKRKLKLADGRMIERDAAQIPIEIDGETIFTVCIFGDSESEPLLGAVTLEEFGLGVNPINKTLVPIPALFLIVSDCRRPSRCSPEAHLFPLHPRGA
ncbi:MAG: clan AA aspartic protease [Candidatus Thermoplasmatota archaeon]